MRDIFQAQGYAQEQTLARTCGSDLLIVVNLVVVATSNKKNVNISAGSTVEMAHSSPP
jgi:hypothetical protein